MRLRGKQRGFTIIEVMIVLAVTAAMFILAAIAVSGRQNAAEFQQAINDALSQIQQSIDQVNSGDYAETSGGFSCTGNGGSGNPSTSLVIQADSSSKQGTNGDCVYLGSVLQFGVRNTTPEVYYSYPIAGLRVDPSGIANTDLHSSLPTAIAPGTGGALANGNIPSAETKSTLLNGLTTKWMRLGSNGNDIAAVAFITDFASLNGSSGGLNPSSRQTNLYAIPVPPQIPADSASVVDAIDAKLPNLAASANPTGGVQICFVSAGTNQSGLVTIGQSGSNLSATLQIKNGGDC